MDGKIKFLENPTCTTCRKAKAFLQKLGADLEFRSLDAQRLSEAELDKLIGERDYQKFVTTRHLLYRTRNMKHQPPAPAEAIRLMAKEANLIRRPVVIRDEEIVFG